MSIACLGKIKHNKTCHQHSFMLKNIIIKKWNSKIHAHVRYFFKGNLDHIIKVSDLMHVFLEMNLKSFS